MVEPCLQPVIAILLQIYIEPIQGGLMTGSASIGCPSCCIGLLGWIDREPNDTLRQQRSLIRKGWSIRDAILFLKLFLLRPLLQIVTILGPLP